MGGVTSFCKKVWSGIKSVAHAVWTGVKIAAKAVVKAVGYIGGILVGIATTALLVAATVISGVLGKFALTIFVGALSLLSIAFLSYTILYGRDNDNLKKDYNINDGNDRVQINQQGGNPGNRPNFEKELDKKYYNLKGPFVNNLKNFIEDFKNKGLKDEKSSIYSFTLDENGEEIIGEELNNTFDEEPIQENVMVSCCSFTFSQFEKLNIINIEMENEIKDDKAGRNILESIRYSLYKEANCSFDFYEENENNSKNEKKNIDNIHKIETIEMRAKI